MTFEIPGWGATDAVEQRPSVRLVPGQGRAARSTVSRTRGSAARATAPPQQRGSSQAHHLRNTYFLVLVATTVGLAVAVPDGEIPSLVALAAAWALVTAVMWPRWQTANQGVVVMLTIMLAIRNYSDLEPAARAWGLLALVIVCLPFIFRPLKKVDGFPFLHLYCFVEGVYVYVSVFFAKPSRFYEATFPPEMRTVGFRALSIFLAVLVFGGLVMGFLLRWPSRARTRDPARSGRDVASMSLGRGAVTRAYVVMVSAMVVSLGVTRTGVAGSLGTLTELLHQITFAAWLVLVYKWLRGELRVWHKLVVVAVPAGYALLTIGDTRLYQAASPGLVVLALWIATRRRIPWILVLGALAALVFVNVGEGELRNGIRAGDVSDSTADVGANWIEYANEGFSGTQEEPLENSAWRFANSDLLGYVATWVPDRYPYYGYEPYTQLPSLLIPRALAPDKPTFGFANEFGRRYELIASSDFETSVNTPFPVEAMVAGGYLPLVVVGLLVGMYDRLLQRIFRSVSAPTVICASIVSLQVVLSTESGILSVVLILPYAMVLYPLMVWVTRDRKGGPRAPVEPAASRPGPPRHAARYAAQRARPSKPGDPRG